jgi:peptidoglycan/xylan/chitin deacetylase (PgdA/CDA1 family)
MAILTIDDAPSLLFAEKLAWLKKERIPALFFVWGEKAAKAEDLLKEALRAGFLLGNHSWTHPHFAELDYEAAREEIEKTDALLSRLHREASVPWDRKYFRFPYFDRGAAPVREAALQCMLEDYGYTAVDAASGVRRDTLCDFDQKEYWLGNPEAPDGLESGRAIMARIGPGQPEEDAVILIHDHEYSHDLFFDCIERYRELGLEFSLP